MLLDVVGRGWFRLVIVGSGWLRMDDLVRSGEEVGNGGLCWVRLGVVG